MSAINLSISDNSQFLEFYLDLSSESLYLYEHLIETLEARGTCFQDFLGFGWNRYQGDHLLYRAKMAQHEMVAIHGVLKFGIPFLPGREPEDESGEAYGEDAAEILENLAGICPEIAVLCDSLSWGDIDKKDRQHEDCNTPIDVDADPNTEEEEE